jgi:hypothetical protein
MWHDWPFDFHDLVDERRNLVQESCPYYHLRLFQKMVLEIPLRLFFLPSKLMTNIR